MGRFFCVHRARDGPMRPLLRHPEHHGGLVFRTADDFSRPKRRWRRRAKLMDGRRRCAGYRRGVEQSRCAARRARGSRSRGCAGRRRGASGRAGRSRSTAFRPKCSAGRWMQGVAYLNDIRAFPIRAFIRSLPRSRAKLDRDAFGAGGSARRASRPIPPPSWSASLAFFDARIAALEERRHCARAADPRPRHGVFPRRRPGNLPDRAAAPAGAEGAASACPSWSRSPARASCAASPAGQVAEIGPATLGGGTPRRATGRRLHPDP